VAGSTARGVALHFGLVYPTAFVEVSAHSAPY